MLARRDACSVVSPPPLVLAAVIHDGDDFPATLSGIQRFPIQKYSDPWLCQGSKREEELSEKMVKLAMHVSHALQRIPAYDPSWQVIATEEFSELLQRRVVQTAPPSLGGSQQ